VRVNTPTILVRTVLLLAVWTILCGPASAQFRDDFNGPTLLLDPTGAKAWGFLAGEGLAVMSFVQGDGFATISVDATKDKRNVWWAFIIRDVSGSLDLARLKEPGWELRIEARIRTSHAPRRVNLHLNTPKTTDFHSHLMEYDIPTAGAWHTISMTTRSFEAGPGDTVNGQMALMDWGLGRYRVDVDYFRVDVVEVAKAGPDKGAAVPYHPPVADPASFARVLPVAADMTVDLAEPGVNLNAWTLTDAGGKAAVVSAGGTRIVLLRWDLRELAGRTVAGSGLLELTARAVELSAEERPDFGLLRVVEVLGGDPGWDEKVSTWTALSKGEPPDRVLNSQMVIDWPVTAGDGGKTYLTIPAPVLQRLVDGKTLGIALTPLGAIDASFYAREDGNGGAGARLRFNLKEE
jgi:hypothetical protein